MSNAVSLTIDPTRYLSTYDRQTWLELLQNEETLPYTQEDAAVFLSSKKTTDWADFCVGKWGYLIGIGIPLALTLASFKAFKSKDEQDQQLGLIILALLIVTFSNAWSMYATGSVTAKASDEQNKEQNILDHMEANFEDLANYMLLQSLHDRSQMVACARKINVDSIREKIQSVTTQKQRIEHVVKYLADVITYLKTGITSKNSTLELKLIELKRTQITTV